MRDQIDRALGHPTIHLLSARGTSVDMAMMTRLVAHLANINLKRARYTSRQRCEPVAMQFCVEGELVFNVGSGPHDHKLS
jgi:hypothetical protein